MSFVLRSKCPATVNRSQPVTLRPACCRGHGRPRAAPPGAVLPWAVLILWLAPPADAGPKWVLTYGRQYGEFMTGGVAGQCELFAHFEDGRPAQVGMTNRSNPGFAIFGKTLGDGNSRITFDINNRYYDFRVFDPPIPSDPSPDCYWLDSLPHYGHYRFEFHWRLFTEPEDITAYPFEPAYHYDLMQGKFNQPPNREPAGFPSDRFVITNWVDFQAQTFVVPPGQNRIIAAKAFTVRRPFETLTMIATIRQGGPTGPQVGPAVRSREIVSNEFPNVLMTWGLEDVPVVPGETYALRLDSLDGKGFNVHATVQNNYPGGMLYHGTTAVPGRDMIAVVVAVGVKDEPPVFQRGDCDQDLRLGLADAIGVLLAVFASAPADCDDACDADDNGTLQPADALTILYYVFGRGNAPSPPFPDCGPDLTTDGDILECEHPVCTFE